MDGRAQTTAHKQSVLRTARVKYSSPSGETSLWEYVAATLASPPPVGVGGSELRIVELGGIEREREQGITTELPLRIHDCGVTHDCETVSIRVHVSNTAARRLCDLLGLIEERLMYRTQLVE